jgi:hypothetical protein
MYPSSLLIKKVRQLCVWFYILKCCIFVRWIIMVPWSCVYKTKEIASFKLNYKYPSFQTITKVELNIFANIAWYLHHETLSFKWSLWYTIVLLKEWSINEGQMQCFKMQWTYMSLIHHVMALFIMAYSNTQTSRSSSNSFTTNGRFKAQTRISSFCFDLELLFYMLTLLSSTSSTHAIK